MNNFAWFNIPLLPVSFPYYVFQEVEKPVERLPINGVISEQPDPKGLKFTANFINGIGNSSLLLLIVAVSSIAIMIIATGGAATPLVVLAGVGAFGLLTTYSLVEDI